MDAQLDIDPTIEQLAPAREEDFPMQEQTLYPVMFQNERPAADILAERLSEGGTGAASPFFLP